MKKTILSAFVLSIALLTSNIPVHAAAQPHFVIQAGSEETVISFNDGSQLIISPIYESKNHINMKVITNTVTKSREVYFQDPNGNLEWKYTLTAVFSYNYGISSTCIDASFTQTIYSDQWIFSDGSATKSGNTAYGKGHYTKKDWFVEVKNIDIDISLTCDSYGNVK